MTEQRWPIAKEGLPFLIPAALFCFVVFSVGMEDPYLCWNSTHPFYRLLFSEIRSGRSRLFKTPSSPRPTERSSMWENARRSAYLKEKALKVSIFMSLFDVHINRSPVSGKVLEKSLSSRAEFLVAHAEKSSLLNEQNAIILETEDRFKILLVQIAGFVARRIVCYAKAGDISEERARSLA